MDNLNDTRADLFQSLKDEVLSASSKYLDFAHAIYLNLGTSPAENYVNLVHESMHYLLGETSFSFMLSDWLTYVDYLFSLTKRENQQRELYFNYNMFCFKCVGPLDKISDRDKDFLFYHYYIHWIYRRYEEMRDLSRMVHEGMATYCSLNFFQATQPILQSFARALPTSMRNDILRYQKEVKTRIIEKDDVYKQGYLLAERIAKRYGVDAVITTAMLAMNTPYYNYNMLCDNDRFAEYLVLRYNPEKRWQYIASNLEEQSLKRVLGDSDALALDVSVYTSIIEKETRRKKLYDLIDSSMYPIVYFYLHTRHLDMVETFLGYEVGESTKKFVNGATRLDVFGKIVDNQLANACIPKHQTRQFFHNKDLQRFITKATRSILKDEQGTFSQASDKAIAAFIERRADIEFSHNLISACRRMNG